MGVQYVQHVHHVLHGMLIITITSINHHSTKGTEDRAVCPLLVKIEYLSSLYYKPPSGLIWLIASNLATRTTSSHAKFYRLSLSSLESTRLALQVKVHKYFLLSTVLPNLLGKNTFPNSCLPISAIAKIIVMLYRKACVVLHIL